MKFLRMYYKFICKRKLIGPNPLVLPRLQDDLWEWSCSIVVVFFGRQLVKRQNGPNFFHKLCQADAREFHGNAPTVSRQQERYIPKNQQLVNGHAGQQPSFLLLKKFSRL